MAYEVVTARFRTELHARWSVFFDHLQVPWAYEPATFHDSAGTPCRPAFWLPRERIWFDAEQEQAPAWWGHFAAAVCNRGRELDLEEDEQHWGEESAHGLPIEVDEEWQGQALISLGGIPDGGSRNNRPHDGPWHRHRDMGMFTDNDAPYQWTLCPQCGLFGAEFWGYAERLACGCLDDRKVSNSGDKRLLAAYRSAEGEMLARLSTASGPRPGQAAYPVVREALVDQEGAALAQARCVQACTSLGAQLRAELPAGAYAEVSADGDVLCAGCPGFVCDWCGVRPAATVGAVCRVCDPKVLLSHHRTRQLLDAKAAEAGKASGLPGWEIHVLLNRVLGIRKREQASLALLGEGLTLVEQWIQTPSLIPEIGTARRRPALSFSAS